MTDHNPPSTPPGSLLLPDGEKRVLTSELFRVRVARKWLTKGLTRDIPMLELEILEDDPAVERCATVEVPRGTYNVVEVGDKTFARLYHHPNGQWATSMPSLL